MSLRPLSWSVDSWEVACYLQPPRSESDPPVRVPVRRLACRAFFIAFQLVAGARNPPTARRPTCRGLLSWSVSASTLLLIYCSIQCVTARDRSLPDSLVTRTRTFFLQEMHASYMAQACEATSYPNWEGFPLRKCQYSVTDKDGTRKSATV
jgi:hypothetical protein